VTTGEKIGKRRTQQREAVVKAIESADGPLSVNDIHDLAAKHCPDIGIATVYRTIKLLLESERVVPVVLPDGITRYELPDDQEHQFFLCQKTGRAYRVELPALPSTMLKKVPKRFNVKDYMITLMGTAKAR